MTDTKSDTVDTSAAHGALMRIELTFDGNKPDCDIIRSALTTLRAELAGARNAALDEAADRIRCSAKWNELFLADAIRALRTGGNENGS